MIRARLRQRCDTAKPTLRWRWISLLRTSFSGNSLRCIWSESPPAGAKIRRGNWALTSRLLRSTHL